VAPLVVFYTFDVTNINEIPIIFYKSSEYTNNLSFREVEIAYTK